jgi:hypothetical protein
VPGHWRAELQRLLGDVRVHAIPVPHDCTDGFYQAFWRRPGMYLRADVRRNISVFHRLPAVEVDRAVRHLSDDLDSGAWHERHGELTRLPELDVGLRLVVAEIP